VDIALDLQQSLKCESSKVGVIIALPSASEGQKVHANAFATLNTVCDLVDSGHISPLIVVDNERINTIYPGLSVESFWVHANKSVSSLFHLFNTISVSHSQHTSFDVNDFKSILNSGIITFGATPLNKWDDATYVSSAVRSGLKKNILSGGLDVFTASVAGAIIIGSQGVLSLVPQANLDHAFEQLTRMLKPGNTVHRGIYRGNKESLAVFTVIGGFARPKEKLEELKKLAHIMA
jgi:cell division GTPase FtsZ